MLSRTSNTASLPAPTLHAGFSASQSKSHVLAGVQDAYWSDDEAEEAECPLCLEEMDISDLNFKPCVCGYQICRFCWNHIKENLNGRCPACRREYTEDGVQFKAVNPEDYKRLTQQKKQRERERKELETLGRRHLANVRVVQRNVAYVTGLGSRFAKEDLIPTLRSNDYFGQYGKISKIIITKRTAPGSRTPVIGLYITYHRREDAAKCIAVVDGAPPPGGGTELMRASYGTTKYCMAFLRGTACSDNSCMNLHEWGDEKDCFTKEDLTTLKHTIKDSETRNKVGGKTVGESEGALPRGASWANKNLVSSTTANQSQTSNRQARRIAGASRSSRSGTSVTTTASSSSSTRTVTQKATAKASAQSTSSRPSTPAVSAASARPISPVIETKVSRAKEPAVATPTSPTTSASIPSEPSSLPKSPIATEAVRTESPVASVASHAIDPPAAVATPAAPVGLPAAPPTVPSAPPGLPLAPPGLSAPPGLPAPKLREEIGSPEIPQQSSYQMSTAARALLDDLKARRDHTAPVTQPAPFPDFDRTLQFLSGGGEDTGGFHFALDPSLTRGVPDAESFGLPEMPDYRAEGDIPFNGNFFTAFPAMKPIGQGANGVPAAPPGLGYPQSSRPLFDPLQGRPTLLERQPTTGSSYSGSFDPFGESGEASSLNFAAAASSSGAFGDEDRKTSRFGFARRQDSTAGSIASTSSPLQVLAQPSALDIPTQTSFYSSNTNHSPALSHATSWSAHRQDFPTRNGISRTNSPFTQQGQAQQAYPPQARYQPYDQGVTEAQLRELIRKNTASQSRLGGEQRTNPTQYSNMPPQQPNYHDPAIMSAGYLPNNPTGGEHMYMNHGNAPRNYQNPMMAYGPPPGLQFRQSAAPSPAVSSQHGGSGQSMDSAHVSTTTSPVDPSPMPLSSSDFPVLSVPELSEPTLSPRLALEQPAEPPAVDDEVKAKAERKAEKKAAAVERAAERARVAQEKAAARAAERARVAAEKTAEKERAVAAKVLKEKEEKERLEQDKLAKVKERAEKAERERVEKARLEKEKQEKERLTAVASAEKQASLAKDAVPRSARGANPSQSDPARNSSPSKAAAAAVDGPQVPLLSKMPKKHKPATKPIRIPKEGEIVHETSSTVPSTTTVDAPGLPYDRHHQTVEPEPTNGGLYRMDTIYNDRASLEDLLDQIDTTQPWMNLLYHPFFDISKINPAGKMPLEYGPLVHALSALSVGGGSFANNMPSGSIDNAVSSFQQLLETLTQTISDLLRLLPRTTWDDSSSFDGVLRDMLKGDDFLDDGGEDGSGRDDEVAALTLALERRARWMEVQLSKLEELHRDINTAAVRAVLSFNDRGWDKHGFLPRNGNTLARFDNLALVQLEDGSARPMTADELESKLVVANEAAVFAETELRESMERMQGLRMLDEDY